MIKPELIGDVSYESIIEKNKLNKYFNIKKNTMYNEQDFNKYFDYDDHYEYLLNNNNTMPIIINNNNNDNQESDISICSNPDDPLIISLYRRKMIKMKIKKQKKKTKITDYFKTF